MEVLYISKLIRFTVGQDGKYGSIWDYVKERFMLSPDDYVTAVLEALKGYENGDRAMKDLFIIPDYKSWLVETKVMDKELTRAFKGQYTQHIIRLQKVEKSEFFPLGVKVCHSLHYFIR